MRTTVLVQGSFSAVLCREIISCYLIGGKTVDEGISTWISTPRRWYARNLKCIKIFTLVATETSCYSTCAASYAWNVLNQECCCSVPDWSNLSRKRFSAWRATITVALSGFCTKQHQLKVSCWSEKAVSTNRLIKRTVCIVPMVIGRVGKSNLDATGTSPIWFPRLNRFFPVIPIWKSISIQGVLIKFLHHTTVCSRTAHTFE